MTPPKTPSDKQPQTTKPSAEAGAADVPERFEDAVTELEQIVAIMESGTLSLEESLASFQRGTQLLRHCRGALESAEQRIRVLQDGELSELPTDANEE
ncbi:MAG: Exodeoxyribonuclease small subunit [Rhodocyclales bacterium]|nr:Exodeoxyribonuclease small subunit [Rhodocyclales bacterium]